MLAVNELSLSSVMQEVIAAVPGMSAYGKLPKRMVTAGDRAGQLYTVLLLYLVKQLPSLTTSPVA